MFWWNWFIPKVILTLSFDRIRCISLLHSLVGFSLSIREYIFDDLSLLENIEILHWLRVKIFRLSIIKRIHWVFHRFHIKINWLTLQKVVISVLCMIKSTKKANFCFYLYQCDEILQAIKQSRGMCAHGPEPMTLYHALCKQINSTSGSDSSEHKLDKGTNLTASYIFNAFSDAEQKKVRQMIEVWILEYPCWLVIGC